MSVVWIVRRHFSKLSFEEVPRFVIELLCFFTMTCLKSKNCEGTKTQIVLLLEQSSANDNSEEEVACKFICLGSFLDRWDRSRGRWRRDENNLLRRQLSNVIWKMASLNNAADWGLSSSALWFQIPFAPTLIFLVIPMWDFSRKRSICLFQSR